MPVLQTDRPKKEVVLPKSGARVWVWEMILAGDIASGLTLDKVGLSSLTALDLIASLVASWDFTDKQGVTLPVKAEYIKLLEFEDFNYLMEQVNAITQKSTIDPEVKKNI